MKKKVLGGVAALSIAAIAAFPSAGQAQVGTPTGCGAVQTIDLSPLLVLKLRTCDAATAPACTTPILVLPPNPLLRTEIDICSP
jgi:hypothetical protein